VDLGYRVANSFHWLKSGPEVTGYRVEGYRVASTTRGRVVRANVALLDNKNQWGTHSEYTVPEDLQSPWMKAASRTNGRSTPPPGEQGVLKGGLYMAFRIACSSGQGAYSDGDENASRS
jgi:hypothetical protein